MTGARETGTFRRAFDLAIDTTPEEILERIARSIRASRSAVSLSVFPPFVIALYPAALNNHGTLTGRARKSTAGRSEIPCKPCDFPSSPPVPLDSHVEDNRTEKETDMNDFTISIDPDEQNAIPRRIVEVTDQDDTIFPEFVEIYAFDAWRPR